MTPSLEYTLGLLDRFPNTPTRTLVNVAMKECSLLFPTPEAARSSIRWARGKPNSCGNHIKETRHFSKGPRPMNPFPKLPKAKHEWDAPWKAVQIPKPAKILLLPDIHFPYYDRDALGVAMTEGKQRECDTILLNGDTMDFFSVSSWQTDPRQRDLAGEIEGGKQLLAAIRDAFPKANIIFKLGNHEERWERFLMVKAPEVLGVADFSMEHLLRLSDIGATVVGDMRPIQAGKLYILHGHEYRFNISNPVNPARGFFLRAKTHVIGSHMHQTSQHSEKTLDNNVISTWSTGCLCHLNPRYRPLNPWNHGFAVISVDARGAFDVDNLRVIDGKAW
jgi:hypothetical protein